ncbi:hypothetical protein [Limnobaculum xujianqingii]|uniref:hypothetical protein n=1 Tax=Limnobaculum xujianqingii TaxID=2738837 RepID=UPI00112A2043|nr:hypothetical protein [Limnobaculum xujianqingii]
MKPISLIEPFHDLRNYETWQSQWRNPELISYSDYLSETLHPETLLISSKLFIPEFISVDNCILLFERYEESNFKLWREKFGDENSLIEKMLNHIHIYDLFGSNADDVTDSIFEQICDVLKCSWGMTLKQLFPTKTFNLESSGSDVGYGPTLTFYQKN